VGLKLWRVTEFTYDVSLLVIAPNENRAIELATEAIKQNIDSAAGPVEPSDFDVWLITDNLEEEGVVEIED